MYIDFTKFDLQFHKWKDAITLNDIYADYNLHNEIVWYIKNMYTLSWNYMKNKNTDRIYLDELERSNIRDWKIKQNFTFQMKKAYIAQYLNEWVYPQFVPNKSLADKDMATKLNQLAKYDIEIMRKQIKDKEILSNVFDYWPAIVTKTIFDHYTATPKYNIINPKYWLPDPSGNVLDNNFRRHLFSTISTRWELEQLNNRAKSKTGVDLYKWLDKLVQWPTFDEQSKHRWDKQNRTLSVLGNNDEIYLLQWYITINDRKYTVTLANAHNTIIRLDVLEPISKSEKEDPTTIEFPVAVYNAFPLFNDPCWISYRELLYDKDRALTKISNAIYRKELTNAWFDNVLVDVDSWVNINHLAYRTDEWTNYIPYSWSNNQGRPIIQNVSAPNDTSSSMNFYDWMVRMSEQDTAIDQMMRWQTDTNKTLWQTQIQDNNQNILFSLDALMLWIGEQMFWRNIYLRSLMENIAILKEKTAILTTVNGMDSVVKIASRDLIWWNSPYVRIVSKKQQLEESQAQLAHLEAFYAMEMQDPNTSPLIAKIYKRTMRALQWFDDDFIHTTVPYDVYEIRAINLMNIINDPKVDIPKNYQYVAPELDIKQQLEAMYYYVNMCIPSTEKDWVLRIINKLILQEWVQVNKEQMDWMWWIANSMWSQMISNKISSNNQQQ